MCGLIVFIGRLPLAGRITIRASVNGILLSSNSASRKKNYLSFLVLMIFFLVAHGYQANLGFVAMMYNAPLWAKLIFVAYAAVNCFVVLAQLHLTWRMTRFIRRSRKFIFRPLPNFTNAECKAMILLTLAGQVIFAAAYFYFR